MVGPGLEPQSNSEVYSLNDNLLPCKMELIIPTHSDVSTGKIQQRRHLVKGGCCCYCGAGGIVGRDNHLPFFPEDNESGCPLGAKTAGLGLRKTFKGSSLEVQWLGLCAFTAEGTGSIPSLGTNILQAEGHGQKKKKSFMESSMLWHFQPRVCGEGSRCANKTNPKIFGPGN